MSPRSLDDAVALMAEYGGKAKLLAGGQSLIPIMKLRLASPRVVVDLNRVPDLSGIREEADAVVIGAMTRHREFETSPTVREHYPLLSDAAGLLADPLVRNRGTIGGSLAHADPASDWGTTLLALGAELGIRGAKGARTVAIDAFFRDPFTTALASDELLTHIRLAKPAPHSGSAFTKLKRKTGDFATVSAAVALAVDGGSKFHHVRVALGGVGPTPLRAHHVERALDGMPGRLDLRDPSRSARARGRPTDRGPSGIGRLQEGYGRSLHPPGPHAGAGARPREEGRMIATSAARPAEHVSVRVKVNSRTYERTVPARLLLVDFLRDDLRLTGTHVGCDTTHCGACTVLVDGAGVKSCTMFAAQVDGSDILTVEGLDANGELSALQDAFRRAHGLQCGFCTPGVLMAAHELLSRNPHPTEKEICAGISGNLCRCTGYQNIVKAVADAAARGTR